MHTGGGDPMLIDLDGDTCMTLKCGADDPDNPTKVLGNGARPRDSSLLLRDGTSTSSP